MLPQDDIDWVNLYKIVKINERNREKIIVYIALNVLLCESKVKRTKKIHLRYYWQKSRCRRYGFQISLVIIGK